MLKLTHHIERIIRANEPLEWATAGGVIVGVFLLGLLLRRLARNQHERFAATEVVELMEVPVEIALRTRLPFLLVGSMYIGLTTLELHDRAWAVMNRVMIGVAFWQLGVWGTAGVDAWLRIRRKVAHETDRAAAGSLAIIGFVARVVVWALVTLLALDNFGINITALVAGLGVGGIAVALAVQNVLGDLFASLTITLDRPFVIGDSISVGDVSGDVEHIGVKSTRIRSISGEQVIIPNADLLGSRVRNFGRMRERRVLFTLGVTYETPRAKLEQIPTWVRERITQVDGVRFDRDRKSVV
jgi:small-conductance mechanosensitive channel